MHVPQMARLDPYLYSTGSEATDDEAFTNLRCLCVCHPDGGKLISEDDRADEAAPGTSRLPLIFGGKA